MSECKIPTGSTDCISRQAVIDLMMQKWGENFSGDDAMQESIDAIRVMPSVTPQEPQTFKWCDTCKEYDQVNHCCHRWIKVIKNTVEDMKREPIIDKIRAEIIKYEGDCRLSVDEYPSCKQCTDNVFGSIYATLDKYKAERTDNAEV